MEQQFMCEQKKFLVSPKFVQRATGLGYDYLRHHDVSLGLTPYYTQGGGKRRGHRRYDIEDVRRLARLLAEEKMAEARRLRF
jgi:hypothetical protein